MKVSCRNNPASRALACLILVTLLPLRALAVDADFVVQADGGGGSYTTVNAAIAAAVAGGASGKIIEIRANIAGTTQVFATGIDLSGVNINSSDEADWLTIRVREGDTIRFRTSGSLLYANGTSRGWKVEGNSSGYSSLQFGDLADYVHTGQNTYRTCYPQERGADIADTCSNYAVRRAQFTGGRAYFANIFDGSDYELDTIAGFDHGTNHYDVHPVSSENQDWGDTVSVRGERVRLSNLVGRHGGHNGWGFLCTTAVLRDSDFSGYWGDISPSPGARAMIMEQVRAEDPFGPMLMENCIIRDSGDSIDETHQTAMKTEGSGLIIRDSFYFDVDSHIWHMNFTNATDSNVSYFSNDAFYHNTSYISKGTWWNNFYDYSSSMGNAQFENNLVANNLFQEVSDNDKYSNPAQIIHYETSGTTFNGYANGFHGTVISGNAVGGPSALKQVRLTTSGGGSATFPIDSPSTGFEGNVYDNVIGTVTFVDVGSPRARTRAGFAVSSWGTGLSAGDAPPLTTIEASSSGATIEVENARPFYDGWGIRYEVGDYIYIGSSAATAAVAGAAQIASIDYANHEITLTASRSVTAGQGVWFGGNPARGAAAIRADRGAHISGSGGGGTTAKLAISSGAVTASTFVSPHTPANAVDDDLGTKWNAYDPETPRDGEWIVFDLGSAHTLDYVKIAWDNSDDRVHTFDIDVSSNGTSWTALLEDAQSSAATGDLQIFEVANTACRYVRVWGHGSQVSPRYITIKEFEAWGYSDNDAPTVNLTSPADSSTYVLGETVNLAASASDSDGIALVEFYRGGSMLIDDDATAPFTASWLPSGTGSYELTAVAHDGVSPPASTTSDVVSISVTANSVPVITTSTLPGGTISVSYSESLAATGGNGAQSWSLDSGALPAGLSLSSGGAISGTPTAAGTAGFTVRVADADGNTGATDEDTQALSIAVALPSSTELGVSGASASTYVSPHVPANSLDNDLGTKWNAYDPDNPRDGEWIVYDLGETRVLDYVKIAWDNADNRVHTFDVDVSTDGTNWTNLLEDAQSSDATGDLQTFELTNSSARYVRIWGYGSQVSPRYTTIKEFEAWGY